MKDMDLVGNMIHYGIINNKGEWHSDVLSETLTKLGFREATQSEWIANGMKPVQGVLAIVNKSLIVEEAQLVAESLSIALTQLETALLALNTALTDLETTQAELKILQGYWDDVDAVKARYDELGKIVQTLTGDGSMSDPYKGWKIGMSVEAGKWYYATDPTDPDNPYLWQAIKSGTPSSALDSEYFDIPS